GYPPRAHPIQQWPWLTYPVSYTLFPAMCCVSARKLWPLRQCTKICWRLRMKSVVPRSTSPLRPLPWSPLC
ncbi:unnamed protein product, partial [Symbiodinium microadriaticum]